MTGVVPLLLVGDSPTEIPGCVLYYLADRLGLNNNDPVGAIPDQSGKGNSFSQGTASKKLTFKTNVVNGRATVFADAIDDEMTANDAPDLDGNPGLTIFVVGRQTALAVSQALLGKWTYQTDGAWVLQTDTATNTEMLFLVADAAADPGNNLIKSTNLGMTTAFQVVEMVYDGSQGTAANRVKFWRNGVQATTSMTGTVPATLLNGGGPLLLGRFGGTLNRFYGGDFGGVAIYKRALSAPERGRVRRWLGNYFGITVV